jgi:hypothetical protein
LPTDTGPNAAGPTPNQDRVYGPARDIAGDLEPGLEQVRLPRDEEQVVAAAGDEARALLGQYWRDGEAEWQEFGKVND